MCELSRSYESVEGCINTGGYEEMVTDSIIPVNVNKNLAVARFELSMEWYLKMRLTLGADIVTDGWRNLILGSL